MQRNILEDLNESQRKAVEYIDGPELVIAGAGSGKTRVLTYKVAYLLTKGLAPWNLLALTFTNKAANEMKERIGRLVGNDAARQLQMGTFHSIFSRILRVEAAHIGFTPSFTIYDEADSRSLIKSLLKEMGLDDKTYKPASVHSRISMAKNHLISPSQYATDHEALQRDNQQRMSEIHKVYTSYCARCRQANAMDFDDLLVQTYLLFKQNEAIRRKYADRFKYILVDEYQDTNAVQQQIVLLLSQEDPHVCVVGDDYQSIYGFRGANIDNILDFQKIYPGCRLFKLEQNYRSTRRIVQVANSLMKHNSRQIPKDVYSHNDEGEKVALKQVYSDREEASVVCKDLKRIKREEKCEYSDFAILYRTNAQSRSFEDELRKQSIPYRLYGGLSFYQRKEIKDIIAYFRLVINPDDEEAMKRVINYPTRGIGSTTIAKVAAAAQKYGASFWEVITNPAHFRLDINKGTMAKFTAFTSMVSAFAEKAGSIDAFELGKEIILTSGIHADIHAGIDPESRSRQENVDEFISSIADFVAEQKEEGREHSIYLADLLQEVALLTDVDSGDDDQPKVTLMTIHSAKGLEFQTVFIVGLEDSILPSAMSMDSPHQMEEERRLLYVAITRAEKRCIMTCAKNRWRYGKMEFGTPSRFIRDIDPALLSVSETSMDDETAPRRLPWDKEYEIDKPYTGAHPWGNEYREYSGRMQNSRPVASQFRADVKPKITPPRRPEVAVDPLSASARRRLQSEGGNLRRVDEAIASGGRRSAEPMETAPVCANGLKEGAMIEHQRFGKGKVVKIEGVGENTKATVEFQYTGTKQLLLKFARFKILE